MQKNETAILLEFVTSNTNPFILSLFNHEIVG